MPWVSTRCPVQEAVRKTGRGVAGEGAPVGEMGGVGEIYRGGVVCTNPGGKEREDRTCDEGGVDAAFAEMKEPC